MKLSEEVTGYIAEGKCSLGIELGSTRIKAILIGKDFSPIVDASYDWENSLVDGIWTYSMDEVWEGIAACYAQLKERVLQYSGVRLTSFSAIGFSAMMHGYLAFDAQQQQLVPFRTWRNNITGEASEKLTALFDYPVPQRWSISHLYQYILEDASHAGRLDYLTTLSGYVHWRLTGEKVLGIGDASGMFPIDPKQQDFHEQMIEQFDNLVEDKGYSWKLREVLPKVLTAGKQAGALTAEGALLMDPSGDLAAGIPLCPPEGDAGTGMVATNSVRKRTGNISAGTSTFAMIVLEKELSRAHSAIDLVTTPDGAMVAMSHSNNCTGEYDAWMKIFNEVVEATGGAISKGELYDRLLAKALEGDADCGGMLCYGYLSGEHITGFSEGRPLVVRRPEASFTLANFLRAELFTAFCAMKTGLNILFEEEQVEVDVINGHGGFFKTLEVGGPIMAAVTNTRVDVLEAAGEGGAWGIALLAAFLKSTVSLPEFLDTRVFGNSKVVSFEPNTEDVAGFEVFLKRYHQGLPIERAAVEQL